MAFEPRLCPIFINVRDRVSDLRELVSWLEQAGHERIIFLDNNSSYPPLLEYYEDTPHEIVRLGSNIGCRCIWLTGRVPRDEYWVLSDPDCVPVDECPHDAVGLLYDLLGAFQHPKAGLGFFLDDTPEFPSKAWERGLVCEPRSRGLVAGVEVFDSLIDTTFALYRPGVLEHSLPAMRTGWPYQMRHTSWYHHDTPSEEESYYLQRAMPGPMGSSWAQHDTIAFFQG